jgi:hypothetical protein
VVDGVGGRDGPLSAGTTPGELFHEVVRLALRAGLLAGPDHPPAAIAWHLTVVGED